MALLMLRVPWLSLSQGFMALLMLRSSGFHGSPYAKELRVDGSPYAKELRVPWLSLC